MLGAIVLVPLCLAIDLFCIYVLHLYPDLLATGLGGLAAIGALFGGLVI